MERHRENNTRWICELGGPLRLPEAEELCPEALADGGCTTKNGLVLCREQPDFPALRPRAKACAPLLARLDKMRAARDGKSSRRTDELNEFIPGYARRALLDKDSTRFNRLYSAVTRTMSREWRRWMEHVDFWNSVLGPRWLGQEFVPEGPAREELLRMLSLRYALLPQSFPNVLPEKGLPPGTDIAVALAQMQVKTLQTPHADPHVEDLRLAALSMLQGDWDGALGQFRMVLKANNTAVYAISEHVLSPVLVYAYICAIRAGAKWQIIQTWGDILQSILPAFRLRGQTEGMVAFLHNLTVLDGIMNRRSMPAYTPDTEDDLACLPIALCYERLSPQLRHKISTERLLEAIQNVMDQGQLLLGYYAAEALSACTTLPESITAKIRGLGRSKAVPLYASSSQQDADELGPMEELENLITQDANHDVEMLHWEIMLDKATGAVQALRPRLRTTAEQATSHELTLNQSATLCREPQDLSALQLARMLEQGDSAALRWVSSLAGHPRLRLVGAGRRPMPISLEVIKPILTFQHKDGALTLTLEAMEDGVLKRLSEREWAAQLHSEMLDSLRSFFRLRGGRDGVTLPDAAADMLFSHYDRLAQCFELRGSLARPGAAQAGELRMVATLTHAAGKTEIRLAVRVCAKAGTDATPGEGPAHMDVKTPAGFVSIDRDLAREKAEADAVCRAAGLDVQAGKYVWTPPGYPEALETMVRLGQAGALLLRDGEEFRCMAVRQERLELHARYMGGEWFEPGADLVVDEDLVYTLRELLAAMDDAHGRFLPVRNGYLLPNEALEAQLQALKALTGSNGRSFGISTAALPALAQSVGLENLPQEMRSRLEAMQNAADAPAPAGLRAELRPYQLQGFRWLAARAAGGIGACLADDMGLGKTIQLISLLLHRAAEGPSLIICPVSLQANWRQELARFAPSLQVDGFRADYAVRPPLPRVVVICSYGLVASNLKEISAVPWNVLALDEAQAIKNPDSQRAKAVCTLHAAVRIALTGTPVENSSMDLWSLMHFLNPLLLGSKAKFRRTFISAQSAYPLSKVVAPLILRRTKAEVLPQLPPLTEMVRHVELSGPERAVYESVRRNALQKLQDGQDRISILAELTRLRRACCHAQLVVPGYTGPASKPEELIDLVSPLYASGHKTLVFSQFTDVLDLVEPLLKREGIPFERLDGSTPARQRSAAVKRFQAGGAGVFLISLKAGGTGLNLTAADYVILLDPWWNPAVEAQAAGRSHRIGQNSPVTLYRLIAADTVEERVLALHEDKKDLAEAILSSASQGPLDSLRELLQE